MKILNREKIYLDTNPQFVTLYDEEKRKSYDIIMYRIDYYDFKFYFSSQTCPIDKKEDCERSKDWSGGIFWVTVMINIIGFSYAFILPKFFLD